MRIFLVDTENVGWAGLTGANKLDSDDIIYILMGTGVNSRSVKGDLVVDLLKSKAQYVIEETKHEGKNYLDFQLSLIIGRLIERYNDAEFIIISKDQGYKAVTDYLEKNNRKGSIAQTIGEYLSPKPRPKAKPKPQKKELSLEDYQSELAKIISNDFPDKKKMIVNVQANAASNKKTKKELKNYCLKNLGDTKLTTYCKMCQIFPY